MKNMLTKCLAAAGFAVCLLASASCNDANVDPRSKEIYKIHHFENNPYLAEVWWGGDYDEEFANKMLCDKYNTPAGTGGCSSWRKGGLHGRNIDWMMRDYATIIVHMPKSEKVKYSSVSLIAGLPAANKEFIDSNELIPENFRPWLPATAVDGINECGLAINHNIIPYDERPYISDGDLPTMMVCRVVLDNCATAEEAIRYLGARKVTQAVVAIAHDYSHFFISDATSSYVVEWIDGEMVATEFKPDGQGNYLSESGMPAVMTNYFVAWAEKYGLKTNEFFRNHPMADGVERAETIMAQLPEAKTVEDHLDICKSVWYSKYCKGETQWATESAGSYGLDEKTGKAYWFHPDRSNIHYMEDDDIYSAAQALHNSGCLDSYYENFRTNFSTISPENTYWFTQHSVVYDIANLKGYAIIQEGMSSSKVIEFGI